MTKTAVMTKTRRTCSDEGCDRKVCGRGLCGKHYQRAVKYGTLPDSWDGNRAEIERVTITCPCGTEVQVTLTASARKRYCSQECKYRYRVRPSGLTYNIVAENPTWFQTGFRPWNAGLVGEQEAWNKGMKFPGNTNSGSFTPGQTAGENNARWRGDDVGYGGLHQWVYKMLTKTGKCEHCGTTARPTEWSNISFEYRRDLTDWQEICHQCHSRYDRENGWGIATAKFGLQPRKKRAA